MHKYKIASITEVEERVLYMYQSEQHPSDMNKSNRKLCIIQLMNIDYAFDILRIVCDRSALPFFTQLSVDAYEALPYEHKIITGGLVRVPLDSFPPEIVYALDNKPSMCDYCSETFVCSDKSKTNPIERYYSNIFCIYYYDRDTNERVYVKGWSPNERQMYLCSVTLFNNSNKYLQL